MVETRESAKNGETSASRRQPARPAPAEETEQLVVTLTSTKGEIVKIEKLDKSGQRHELSETEYAKLAGQDEVDELEDALEEAYEAGFADAGEEDEDEEDEDELAKALRSILVGRIVGRRQLRRGLRRLALHRALRRRILGQQPRR